METIGPQKGLDMLITGVQVLLVTLTMAMFCLSVPVRHHGVKVSLHEKFIVFLCLAPQKRHSGSHTVFGLEQHTDCTIFHQISSFSTNKNNMPLGHFQICHNYVKN